MNIHTGRALWGGGYNVGSIVQFSDGRIALCVEHTGDHHCAYRTLVTTGNETVLGETFYAYDAAGPTRVKTPPRAFHLLMAGEPVKLGTIPPREADPPPRAYPPRLKR